MQTCRLATQKAWADSKRVEFGCSGWSYRRNNDLLTFLIGTTNSCKFRAKKKGIPFTLTAQFLFDLFNKQRGRCAITGWKMTAIAGKGAIHSNISVDKINRDNGYIKENVQLVCSCINGFKNVLSKKELLDAAISICRLNGYTVIK